MADPTKYTPDYSFTDYQANRPSKPLPAVELDTELANIADAIGGAVDAVKDIRRSDGRLQNRIVTADSLSEDLLLGLKTPRPWEPSHRYIVLDTVIQTFAGTKSIYRCIVSHESSTFATDIELGYWELILDLALVGGDMFKGIYDPRNKGADAFDRANHTGPNAPDDESVTSEKLGNDLRREIMTRFKTGASLLADTTMGYAGSGAAVIVGPGDIVEAGGARYAVAAGDAAGAYYVDTAGGLKLDPLPDSSGWVSFAQFGGIEGDNQANALTNTLAARRVSAWAVAKVGMRFRLGKGIWIIGYQTINPNPSTSARYYQNIDMFNAAAPTLGVGSIEYDFAGGKLKLKDGLKFGSFDPLTGEPWPSITLDTNRIGQIGYVVRFDRWASVIVRDIDIEGNNTKLSLGGFWGDQGRQIIGYNLYFRDNLQLRLLGGKSVNAPLDCLYVHGTQVSGGGSLDPVSFGKRPVYIENLECIGGTRQAFSLGGGIGGYVVNCKFNDTGQTINEGTGAVFGSSPNSGLDIEAEVGGIVRHWDFEFCEFTNNRNVQMVADSGDTADVTFSNCKFIQSQTSPQVIWPKKPRYKFIDCDIVGKIVSCYHVPTAEYQRGVIHPDATQFIRGTIRDGIDTTGAVIAPNLIVDTAGSGRGTLFKGVRFIRGYHRSKAGFPVSDNINVGAFSQNIIDDCEIQLWVDEMASSPTMISIPNSLLKNSRIINLNPGVTLVGFPWVESSGSATRIENCEILDPTDRFRWAVGGAAAIGWHRKIFDATNPMGTVTGSLARTLGTVPGLAIATNWATGITSIDATNYVRIGAITSGSSATGELRRGDVFFTHQPSAGGPHAYRCTTAGTGGSTAVTKSFGLLEA